MIIFISPSKTFKNTTILPKSEALFTNKTEILHNKLSLLSLSDIETGFKISNTLAINVYNYINSPKSKKAAIHLYDGTLYKMLDYQSTNKTNHKLYILSAYYGLIRPFDGITPYRLDFNQKVIKDLYSFWKPLVNKYLNKYQNELLINLASKEFYKLLDESLNYITIDFKLNDRNISNVLLKQMRGKMAHTILNNSKLKTVEDLKSLVVDSFTFNNYLSTDKLLIFTR